MSQANDDAVISALLEENERLTEQVRSLKDTVSGTFRNALVREIGQAESEDEPDLRASLVRITVPRAALVQISAAWQTLGDDEFRASSLFLVRDLLGGIDGHLTLAERALSESP